MKIADILPLLTIQPLRRFGDAWGVKPITGEKRVVEQAILGELHRINTEEAVNDRLTALERKLDYMKRANAESLLRHLVDQPGYLVAYEVEFISHLVDLDAAFLEYAKSATSLRHVDRRTIDICQSVLEVAWEDQVTFDEYRLIRRLEEKLGVCRRDHRVIEVRITDRSCLTSQEVEEALRVLNYEGFVFQFKSQGSTQIVIPEEIAVHLRSIFGLVLQAGAYRNLASKLSATSIKEVLEQARQPAVSLKKDFLVDRLIDGEVSPATLLEHLGDKALDSLLAEFPGQKQLTMKAVKIRNLISHFDRSYVRVSDSASEDPDRIYHEYREELASRQYDVLRAANVISRDQNVDRFFERGVRYTFRTFFGHASPEFTGSTHADGGVEARNGRMALWDCKSATSPYSLTDVEVSAVSGLCYPRDAGGREPFPRDFGQLYEGQRSPRADTEGDVSAGH